MGRDRAGRTIVSALRESRQQVRKALNQIPQTEKAHLIARDAFSCPAPTAPRSSLQFCLVLDAT